MTRFSEEAWQATAEIRTRIDSLPLLVELSVGTLEPHRFVEYLVQDDFYLTGYSRALAMLATRAPSASAAEFWEASASGATLAESEMHAALLGDPRLSEVPRSSRPSPTTRAYVNMLQTVAAFEPYPVGVAAVLPCFWVYADVGKRLVSRAAGLTDHPYGSWVQAYDDPAFQESTRQAIALMDHAAEGADPRTRRAMLEAFVDATWYEEQFWARSYDLQRWDTSVG